MNLFGLYVPGTSPWHRLDAGWKYLALLALTLPGLLAARPLVSLGSLLAATAVLASCGLGLRQALALPLGFWFLAAALAGYQLLFGQPAAAIVVSTNLVTAVYASRLLTLTTPAAALIDALVAALRPVRRLGLPPERIGLAIAVMLRSVPLLLDTFGQVRDAARARGQERNPFLLVTPVVVRAVGQAQAIGAALAARGLGDA